MDNEAEPCKGEAHAYVDAARAARFVGLYDGDWAVEDALRWLQDLDRAEAPGLPSPTVEVDRLRRAMYRSDASPADRAAYEQASAAWQHWQSGALAAWAASAAPADTDLAAAASAVLPAGAASMVSATPSRRTTGSWRRGVVVGGLLVVLLGGTIALLEPPVQSPGQAAPAIMTAVSTPGQDTAFRASLARAFAGSDSYAAVSAVETVARRTDSESPRARQLLAAAATAQGAGVSVTGARVVVNGSFRYVHDLEAGSRIFVQLLTSRPVSWQWRIIGVSSGAPDPEVVAVVAGSEAAGTLQEALLQLPTGVTPVRFEIETDGHAPFRWRSITDGSSRIPS